jgi:hypothetical protein
MVTEKQLEGGVKMVVRAVVAIVRMNRHWNLA